MDDKAIQIQSQQKYIRRVSQQKSYSRKTGMDLGHVREYQKKKLNRNDPQDEKFSFCQENQLLDEQ